MAKETCIICGVETPYDYETHIDMRLNYVEGAGQCCTECYNRVYNTKNDSFIEKLMENRRTLITISAEDILNTPNDMELGAKVREIYWNLKNNE